MASIVPSRGKWLARIRKQGFPPQSKTFGTKILAEKWARQVEGDIDAGRAGVRPTSALRVKSLIERYRKEVGEVKPFGRNKADVLKKIETWLGDEDAYTLTPERVVKYILKERRIKGVTASIDLTYLKGVLKVAKALWRHPVQPSVVDDAREMLKYMGLASRSNERDRRPTKDEIERIKKWLDERSVTLTSDHIDFILASCLRPPSEVTGLRWADLNREDKTILIHDRKDPRKKIGNNQIVPLLHGSFEIICRQRVEGEFIFPVNGKSWSSIFPRACAELGIENLTLYDLRHEAISRMVEADKHSIPEMCLISGHKDPKQLMRYTQLQAKDLHR